MWKTANIEVDGITFPDTEEIFEGRASEGMRVGDIVAVNNLKRAWGFLFDHVDEAVDWPFVSYYNRIIAESLIADSGKLRTVPVRIGGTDWVPQFRRLTLCETVSRRRRFTMIQNSERLTCFLPCHADNGFRMATSERHCWWQTSALLMQGVEYSQSPQV
ncbi:MAG: hypothetical protein ABF448_04705 [Bifidobacterium aquikefiri]